MDERHIKEMTTAGLNLIGQGLTIFDRDLRLVVCNRPFQRMFPLPAALTEPGASFEETIRHLAVIGEYGDLEDIENFVAARVAQARAFEPHYMERTRANGRTISIEGAPLPQGGWITVYTDITRQKRTETLLHARSEELSDRVIGHTRELLAANRELAAANNALEEVKRQLTEAEARTRLTAEMMPAHLAHVDGAGRYTYSNRRLSAVLPGAPSEIVGRAVADVLGPANYARIAPHLAAAFDGRGAVFEFTEDQASRRIRTALTPDGADGVYLLSMDVTEESQARAALQQTRRRALAAQVTSGLAHDFSNLLTIILGMQGRLARMDLGAEAEELIEATQVAARRGGRLLNRIAAMTGRNPPQPRPCDLHALLDELRILATPSLPRAIGLSILDNLPEGPVLLDPGMLQDALLNLVLNARDACGGAGQITVAAHVTGQTWIDLIVSDTGGGFSDTALAHAIEPFFTTKGGGGSGLGLPMVYDMAKLAGGDLRLANSGGGAEVTLRLPYRPAPSRASGLALLVEDSEALRALARDMLMGLGYSVIEAASAEEAAALAGELPEIALVLSDIRLQGEQTGLDLVRRLAKQGFACLLMTSLPETDPLHRAARAEVPVLRKPFGREALARLLPGAEEAA